MNVVAEYVIIKCIADIVLHYAAFRSFLFEKMMQHESSEFGDDAVIFFMKYIYHEKDLVSIEYISIAT